MAVTANELDIHFVCAYGRWHCNVYEGDYTIWPGRGVEVRHKDGPDDPHPIVELVVCGVIGPPIGPDENKKPRLCGLENDKWKKSNVRGVFIADKPPHTN